MPGMKDTRVTSSTSLLAPPAWRRPEKKSKTSINKQFRIFMVIFILVIIPC